MLKNAVSTFLLCSCLAFMASCDKHPEGSAQKGENTDTSSAETQALATTSIHFADSSFDFGNIKEGEKVEHTFTFENTGAQPLVVSSAQASCGCTIPEWTRDPVLPGKEGKITVKYNSSGKEGAITKTVSVYANTEPGETILHIAANVIKEKVQEPSKTN